MKSRFRAKDFLLRKKPLQDCKEVHMKKMKKGNTDLWNRVMSGCGNWRHTCLSWWHRTSCKQADICRGKRPGCSSYRASWNPQKGLLTVPGSSVAKDPQITNTSELNMNELAALKCEFVYSQNCPDKSKRGKVLSAQDMEKVVQVIPLIITVMMPLKENGCDLLSRKRQTLYSIFTTRKFWKGTWMVQEKQLFLYLQRSGWIKR